jgi:hypothetical protein
MKHKSCIKYREYISTTKEEKSMKHCIALNSAPAPAILAPGASHAAAGDSSMPEKPAGGNRRPVAGKPALEPLVQSGELPIAGACYGPGDGGGKCLH